MANKHFTTNRVLRERERDIRASRLQREKERQALLKLQRTFDVRGGRVVR